MRLEAQKVLEAYAGCWKDSSITTKRLKCIHHGMVGHSN